MSKKRNRLSKTSSENAEPASSTNAASTLLFGDEALAKALGVPISTVRTLRKSRAIPYSKLGHRTIVYNLSKVLDAIERLEIKAVTAERGR